MRVIFLQNVAGVAKRGDVKEVASGYAQNFLLPNGLAEMATSGRVSAMKEQSEQKTAKQEVKSGELAQQVSELAGKQVSISVKANPKGGLFAMVTAEDIIKHLGVKLSPDQIFILEPIKSVGEHIVEVRGGDATAKITVTVQAKA